LQFAWNEYGAEAFEFVILETCQRSECLMREQAWMILRRCTDPKFGFNIKTYANGSGFTKHTREQKQRMLDGMRHRARRPQIAATREKIANALRGKPLNADRKAKIARAHAKPETKARISAAQKIRWQLLKGGQIAS
jgi:group I intron endonuclease